jgi:hypothetical protein
MFAQNIFRSDKYLANYAWDASIWKIYYLIRVHRFILFIITDEAYVIDLVNKKYLVTYKNYLRFSLD